MDVRTDKISPVFYRKSSLWGRCSKGYLREIPLLGPYILYSSFFSLQMNMPVFRHCSLSHRAMEFTHLVRILLNCFVGSVGSNGLIVQNSFYSLDRFVKNPMFFVYIACACPVFTALQHGKFGTRTYCQEIFVHK